MNNASNRLLALITKEFKQLLRDRSSLLIGVVLPILLIFIMGYGISMDVKKVPTAVVLEDSSPIARDLLSFTTGSDYFDPRYAASMQEAITLMDSRRVDAIIRVPNNFSEALTGGQGQVQLILYGVDPVSANVIRNYVEGAISIWQAKPQTQLLLPTGSASTAGSVSILSRMWFNDANTSTWYFIPGLMVVIMTLVGVFLTALVMAREWERGTLEAIFITPVRPLELLLAKMLPYFCVAMFGFTLCLLAARYLFLVPIHGSLFFIFFSSMLYLLVALGIGLTISAVTKNQFLACQAALLLGFLPTVMLSGFLFDLRSVPPVVSAIGHVLPPTYYMQLLKSLLLGGNNYPLIIKNCLLLAAYAVIFLSIALHVTRKRLE